MSADADLSLVGKTALVTGSGRNLGRAIALELASRGANVIVNTRSNKDEGLAVVSEIQRLGVGAELVLGDAADQDVLKEMFSVAHERFGMVDISVSNAAKRLYKSFFETTDDDWRSYLDQQLTASWNLAKLAAEHMCKSGWGRLIHINGPDGWVGGPTRIPHSVAKGGLRTLTKSLAASLGPYGITVNDVVPGFADTIRDPETHPNMNAEKLAELRTTSPIRRLVSVEEVAWACSFLCSTRSGGITGTALHVNGGTTLLG